MSERAFRRFPTAVLVVLTALSFAAIVVLPALYEPDRDVSRGANARSPSSIGHVALVRLLEALGIPVLVSGHASDVRAGSEGVLLLLEPVFGGGGPRRDLFGRFLESDNVLIVLPKWRVVERPDGGSSVQQRPLADANAVLDATGVGGTLVRRDGTARGASAALRIDPTFARSPVQCVERSDARVLATAAGGAVLLERRRRGHHLLVLSDPDVLSNAGLHRDDNATFVLAAIERLRHGRGAVVVDEMLHGYERPPSLARELASPPLVFAMGHVLVALLLVAWAVNVRFGAPAPDRPPFEPGSRHLVRTTAELLRAGGHAHEILPRYLAGALDHVRAALHPPARLEGEAFDAWLDRVGAHRGATEHIGDLRAAVRGAASASAPGTRVLDAAARVDRWRREIVDGSAR